MLDSYNSWYDNNKDSNYNIQDTAKQDIQRNWGNYNVAAYLVEPIRELELELVYTDMAALHLIYVVCMAYD